MYAFLRAMAHKTAGVLFDVLIKEYKLSNLTFQVPKDLTDREFRGRFVLGTYESRAEYDFVDKYLDHDATLLELGGCLGVMSCYSNRTLKAPTQHVVVEANPLLISWLSKNRDANGCAFHIAQGVVSQNISETFHVHDLIVGGSVKRHGRTSVTVPGWTYERLQDILGRPFDALIMDIEGGEHQLLTKYPDFFSTFRTVFLELHPFAGILSEAEARECEDALSGLGFRKVDSNKDNTYQVWRRA